MSWQTATATSKQQLISIFRGAEDLLQHGMVQIQMRNHEEGRKEKQNRLAFHWYRELAEQSGNEPDYYRAFCKYHFGIPILIEDEQCRAKIETVFKPLDYETRLKLMTAPFDMPVTSLFTVKEFARYLNKVELHFTERSYKLTTGDDLYFEATMNERMAA